MSSFPTARQESRIIRPTRTRRHHLHSHRPCNPRRRKHKSIHPVIPLRSSLQLTPQRRRLPRIDKIRRRPAHEISTRDIALQRLVILIAGRHIESGAFNMTLDGSVGAEGGEVDHRDDARLD